MPNITDNELGVMIDELDDAGFEIRIASHAYDPYESESRTITADLLVSDVDMTNFDALVIPCLAAGVKPLSQEIAELVKECYRQEKAIAAQHGATVTLFRDGLITIGQMNSREVLQEGKIITSGCCPVRAEWSGCEDGTRELIEKLIATLNEGE
jgi:putative intracellular protease/amidase